MQGVINYADPSDIRFTFPCIKVKQPIGDLYIGSLPFKVLCAIADFDVRRVMQEDRDVERYLGIQRQINQKRVKELEEYVNFSDASFPGSIIIAVDDRCAAFDQTASTMTLSNVRDSDDPVLVRQIARVIDGQHRIAGLYQCRQENFDCPVTILVGMDIADQGLMFARVNLSQTPVNRSLVYDLFELTQSRSPQKLCHDITVRLDREIEGPFFKRIKRLGIATPGRNAELLSQATIVKGIMPHISDFPDRDRDALLRRKTLPRPSHREKERMILREWFLDERDEDIYSAIDTYFDAVRERWPKAWQADGRGYVLPRTNGYLALMRFFRDSWLYWSTPGKQVSKDQHLQLLRRVALTDDQITTEMFLPGTSGEAALYKALRDSVAA
ncbi:DGQHR domain-containing protein [Caulobacter sp. BE254]|uniref:DGQHR domain-containing protein n=1 Tax=Caulobacter sp. BE254 TaxID=2817720 RepID=UPI002866FD67|nr:DGQHR domain-containing protein [Caulobacter sp. BE254]MDR7118366.1 DGQHR domain-containing protein [Caulobacter sp. BE254]